MTSIDQRIQKALDFAKLHHEGQYRSDGLPYIVHPIAVMCRLRKWGITKEAFPEMWIAALCHDLIEDTEVTSELLEVTTDPISTSYVEHLTFRSRLPDENSRLYQAAKSDHLTSYKSKPLEVQAIKWADRFENVEGYIYSNPNYALTYWHRADGLWETLHANYNALKDRFGVAVVKGIFQDYEAVRGRVSRCGQ